MLYVLCIKTPDEYPFLKYFKSQYIVREYGENGDNPHWQGIVNLDPSREPAARQHIKEWTTRKNQYSFKLARNPRGLPTYLAKEGHQPIVSTFNLEDYLSGKTYTDSMSPKISHKKNETFLQYVLHTWTPPSPPHHNAGEQHVMKCFIEMEQEISKQKFRNIYTTLCFHFPEAQAKTCISIPSGWTQIEQ